MKKIILPLFFITFFLGLTNNNPNNNFGGYFLIFSILILLTAYMTPKIIFDKKIYNYSLLVFLYPILFSVYYALAYKTLNEKYVYLILQTALIIVIFHAGLQFYQHKKIIGYYVFSMVFMLVFASLFLGKSSIVGKENIYASILLILFTYVLSSDVNKTIKILLFAFSLYGIFLSDARSSLVAFLFAVLLYVFYDFFIIFRKIIFFSVLFLSISWIFFIVYLYDTGIGDKYNLMIYELTGKQLYSGREKMWGDFASAIFDSPIFGYGFGVDYSKIADVEYSTHNLYLAIMMQQGLLGLFLFVFLVYAIFIGNKKQDLKNKKPFAFIVIPVVFLQQNFELSLTQNNLSIMLIFWFLLGVSYYSIARSE